MIRRLFVGLVALALILAPLGLVASLPACGATPHRVAAVSVVTLGSALSVLHQEHQAAFTHASDQLIDRLAGQHGTPADYDRESVPLAAAFRARGEAIYALDSVLYAAAALIDAAHDGSAPSWLPAAKRITEALDRAASVLADGSVLPVVPIPREIRDVLAALRALTGGL